MIGAVATGLGDQYPTPASKVNSNMPGIEIHANILDGLLNNIQIHRVTSPVWAPFFTTLPVLLFLTLLLLLRERQHLMGLIIFGGTYLFLVTYLLWYFHIWLQPVVSLVGIALGYLLWSWRRLSVFQNHINVELKQLRLQTGHLFNQLPTWRKSSFIFRPHALELNIERVHRLGSFVTDSLLKLPVAVVLFDDSGQVLMHNPLARDTFGMDINNRQLPALLTAFDPNCTALVNGLNQHWSNLESCELAHSSGRVLTIHVVNIQMQASKYSAQIEDSNLWQLSLIDLSNERSAQKQRNELMTFMSHDLRSPQVGILSLIKLYTASTNTMSLDDFLMKITNKVHATLSSASDLLALARAQDKSYYAFEEVNLASLISTATEHVWAQAHAKSIKISASASINANFDSLWLKGDGDMIVRALVNILSNAIRYSHDNTSITIIATKIGHEIECSITDQGIGMDFAQLNKLNFSSKNVSRIHAQHADAAGSFGIGISMVKAVMAQHDGRVFFESSVGVGTTVHLMLPAAPDEIVD